MITSKQRAYLRGLAHHEDAIFHVGKQGVIPEITESIDDALEARELVKVGILNNCMMDVREIADIISGRTHSDVVQVVGRKIVFYRKSRKKPTIELPK